MDEKCGRFSFRPLGYGMKCLEISTHDTLEGKLVSPFAFFVNNTNVTFLAFLYKIGSITDHHSSDAYLTVLIHHALSVSDFQILIKSCSIEARKVQKVKWCILS